MKPFVCALHLHTSKNPLKKSRNKKLQIWACFYFHFNRITVPSFTPAADGLYLKSPGDMKFWGLGARMREGMENVQKGWRGGSRKAEKLLSESALPSCTWAVPKELLCSRDVQHSLHHRNKGRMQELEVKDEILAKSCWQEFPCRALAKCPGLGVWTRAGLTHTVCCSWLIPSGSNNTLSHHSHRQGNCGIYRVNTWLQIHCASRKEEEEEEELHWSKSYIHWNHCSQCWSNTGQMQRCQQRIEQN